MPEDQKPVADTKTEEQAAPVTRPRSKKRPMVNRVYLTPSEFTMETFRAMIVRSGNGAFTPGSVNALKVNAPKGYVAYREVTDAIYDALEERDAG